MISLDDGMTGWAGRRSVTPGVGWEANRPTIPDQDQGKY
jgi:hypothetical protein